jgi:hypothetical protein
MSGIWGLMRIEGRVGICGSCADVDVYVLCFDVIALRFEALSAIELCEGCIALLDQARAGRLQFPGSDLRERARTSPPPNRGEGD